MRGLVRVIAGMALITSIFLGAQPGAQALPTLVANDNFADATVITSLPFTEATSNALATIEPDEPQACDPLTKTLWYRYTPTEDGIVSFGSSGGMTTAVFLGTTLADLRTAVCSGSGAILPVFAGTTYHIQIGADSASTSFTVSANAVSGISGRVTETSGAPVRDYCLISYDEDGSWDDFAYTSDGSWYQRQAAEEYEGIYIFYGPTPGAKKIEFGCGEGLFEPQWYQNKSSYQTADPIQFDSGDEIVGIDATLVRLSTISGVVTDAGGDPIEYLCIESFDQSGDFSGYTYSDEAGHYSLPVPAGTHRVLFSCFDEEWAHEYYNNKTDLASADPITVPVSGEVTGIDATLDLSGRIEGQVTDESGDPLSFECVEGLDSSGAGVASDYTNSMGYYHLWVPDGTYRIRFGCGSRQTEYYNNQLDLASADPVTVTGHATVGGIDASLAPWPAPSNDARTAAIELLLPGSVSGTTAGATSETPEPAVCGTNARSVWYRFTPSETTDVALRVNGYSQRIGIYLDEGAQMQGLQCAASSGGAAFGAVHALAGKTYYVQVASAWGQAFTLTTSKTPTAPLTFEAPTPCGPLCPYWNQQTNTELDHEASCAPTPASPDGSWADHAVTVPAATNEWTPSALLFHIEPELDYDSWICRAVPDSNGKYFVATAANLVGQPCPIAVLFGCYENAVARVQPGETYTLRVYNWSDKPSTPGGYSFH